MTSDYSLSSSRQCVPCGSAFSLAWVLAMPLRLENPIWIEMGVNYTSDKTEEKEISVENHKERSNQK